MHSARAAAGVIARHVALPHANHRRFRLRVARWALVGLLTAVGGLALAGLVYQNVAARLDERAFPPPGQMIDVGGHQLHISCTGQGRPTVILETGLAAESGAWALVQPAVASMTRTCSYDRAGMGWSQTGPEPRDARHIATELHTLLQAAALPGPYVLVGHSNGSLYTHMYAGLFPDEVAGMVLADGTPTDLFTRLPETRSALQSAGEQAKTMQMMAHVGLARLLFGPQLRTDLCGFPTADAIESTRSVPAYWQALGSEVGALEATQAQVAQVGGLGARPLLVLSSTEGAPSPAAARIKHDMDDELAALSTNGQHQVVDGATHQGLVTNPVYAAITSQAIREVVEAVRSGKSLERP
jgi:pimeloyl-ACP methyl ester carboxylesterase